MQGLTHRKRLPIKTTSAHHMCDCQYYYDSSNTGLVRMRRGKESEVRADTKFSMARRRSRVAQTSSARQCRHSRRSATASKSVPGDLSRRSAAAACLSSAAHPTASRAPTQHSHVAPRGRKPDYESVCSRIAYRLKKAVRLGPSSFPAVDPLVRFGTRRRPAD